MSHLLEKTCRLYTPSLKVPCLFSKNKQFSTNINRSTVVGNIVSGTRSRLVLAKIYDSLWPKLQGSPLNGRHYGRQVF